MPKTLMDTWTADQSARQETLDRARRCAALTVPAVLPPENHGAEDALPEPFQSLGATVVTTLKAKMALAMFPPGHPWFQLMMSPVARLNPAVPDEDKLAMDGVLARRELLVTALLESVGVAQSRKKAARRRRTQAFRTAMLQHLGQAIITGQALTRMHDDWRFQVFRRDAYAIKRDSSGDILRITIKERIDPMELPEAMRRKAELDDATLSEKDPVDRMVDLYTQVRWQPATERWLVLQECNGRVIAEREELVSSFIETPYELINGDDEGRGFVETRLGDLSSIDTLRERMLDFAAILSDFKIFKDIGCQVRDEDLVSKPGSIVSMAEVSGGQVQNLAMLQSNKNGDYAAILNHLTSLEDAFKGTVSLHQNTTPRGERVTAQQVRLVAQEVEEATGGFFVPLADSLQRPLTELAIYRAETQKILAPLPDDTEDIHLLTGLTAVAGANKAAELLEVAAVANGLGPEAQGWINMGALFSAWARYRSIYEPGLFKTPAQKNAEAEAAFQQAVAASAAQQSIEVAGDAARAAVVPA